jgi:hypothetical protein
LLALCALAVTACAPPGVHRKVRGIIRDLAVEELGPADRYEVYTSRDSVSRLKAGRISLVKIHGINVRPVPGYVLDEVFVEGHNVKANLKQRTVESADSTAASAYIGEANLARMIADNGPLEEPTVRISQSGVEISGRYEFAGVPMTVNASGKLSVTPPAGVTFTSDRVTAGSIPVPVPVNRTIDFQRIYAPLVVTGVATEPGRVVLTGTIDWTKFGHGSSE